MALWLMMTHAPAMNNCTKGKQMVRYPAYDKKGIDSRCRSSHRAVSPGMQEGKEMERMMMKSRRRPMLETNPNMACRRRRTFHHALVSPIRMIVTAGVKRAAPPATCGSGDDINLFGCVVVPKLDLHIVLRPEL